MHRRRLSHNQRRSNVQVDGGFLRHAKTRRATGQHEYGYGNKRASEMQTNQTQGRIAAQPNTDRVLNQPIHSLHQPTHESNQATEQLALLGWGVFEASEFGSLWIAWNARGVVCLSFGQIDALDHWCV